MSQEAVKIVVVGEVDHGKSTLIGRLLLETGSLSQEKREDIQKGMDLAFLTDQFKEERDEERTIDATQVYLQAKKKRFCLIDTPGHLEFIKNMMTGTTRADAALVVVDAQFGLQEQTKRHAALLGLLGIWQVIIVVNKMDLVGYDQKRFLVVKQASIDFFEKAGLKVHGVIPVSAHSGDNVVTRSKALRWYTGLPLSESLEAFRIDKPNTKMPLRLPVQDVYKINGKKIVVGRVESGSIRPHQQVVLLPSGKKTKIAAIKFFRETKPVVVQGENAGLVLRDPILVQRGEIICGPKNVPLPSRQLRGNVFWISGSPLRAGAALSFRCATQETRCHITEIVNARQLKDNETGIISIKTAVPVVVEQSDVVNELGRFVLESDGKVCGMGVIVFH